MGAWGSSSNVSLRHPVNAKAEKSRMVKRWVTAE
jgi:hypothetical protein